MANTEDFMLQDQPAVDLLIRTSGETRLSDFLLWQSATAQLAFVPALWPDFSYLDFVGTIVDYQLGFPAMQVACCLALSSPPEKQMNLHCSRLPACKEMAQLSSLLAPLWLFWPWALCMRACDLSSRASQRPLKGMADADTCASRRPGATGTWSAPLCTR